MTEEPTIRTRCRRIAGLIRHGQGSPAENLIDLLADARHWCDRNGQNFGDLDRQAYRHYFAEIDQERSRRHE